MEKVWNELRSFQSKGYESGFKEMNDAITEAIRTSSQDGADKTLIKIREIWLRSLPKEIPHHTINLTVRRDAREKVFEADNLDEIAKLLFAGEDV